MKKKTRITDHFSVQESISKQTRCGGFYYIILTDDSRMNLKVKGRRLLPKGIEILLSLAHIILTTYSL